MDRPNAFGNEFFHNFKAAVKVRLHLVAATHKWPAELAGTSGDFFSNWSWMSPISCFLIDLELISKIFKISSNGSSSFASAHLFQTNIVFEFQHVGLYKNQIARNALDLLVFLKYLCIK